MFQREDVGKLFSKLDNMTLQNSSNPHYHQVSFAAFLRLVKRRVSADWDNVMDALLDLVKNDPTILMDSNYFQELFLQLHLLGVDSMPTLLQSFNHTSHGPAWKDLRAWKDISAVVYITLKVPRARLGVSTKIPATKIGTPIVHCILSRVIPYTAFSGTKKFLKNF
jgi:hypothetical protein